MPPKSPLPPVPDAFASELQLRKHESTLQLLFKAARLVDETALERVAARRRGPRLRRSHMALFPHIDLAGTRITELAERLGVSKQAVSQLVDDLEQLGVVSRTPDPDDARARRVVFTERGRAGLLEGLQLLQQLEQELAARMPDGGMQALRVGLLQVLDALPGLPAASG